MFAFPCVCQFVASLVFLSFAWSSFLGSLLLNFWFLLDSFFFSLASLLHLFWSTVPHLFLLFFVIVFFGGFMPEDAELAEWWYEWDDDYYYPPAVVHHVLLLHQGFPR